MGFRSEMPLQERQLAAARKVPLRFPWDTCDQTNLSGKDGQTMLQSPRVFLVFWGLLVGMGAAVGFLSVV
jgi:hypothetical protein